MKEEGRVTDTIQIYGAYLGGDPGCQDYTKQIKLQGVKLVDSEYLDELTAQRNDAVNALLSVRALWADFLPAGNSKAMRAMKLVDAAIARAKGEAK